MIDWKKISSDIVANLGDQGKVTQILSDAETDVTTFNTRFADLEKKTTDYEGQIDSLQKTNMNLFLKQGNPVPVTPLQQTEKALTYEDLVADLEGGK